MEQKRLCKCGCGGIVTSKNTKTLYLKGHAARDPEIKKRIVEKGRNTCFTRYGVQHISQVKEIKEKKKQINLEKYGVECSFQSKEIKDKIKQTILEKYGVEYISQVKEIKDKIKQSNLQKYGTVCPLNNETVHKKTIQTNLEKYGTEIPMNSEDIKEKYRKSCLENYGYLYASQSDIVKQKVKETNLERYGVECALNNQEVQTKTKQTNLEKYKTFFPTKNTEIKNKIRQSNIKIYGTQFPTQCDRIKQKIFDTCERKYNTKYVSQLNFIKDKIKQTNLEKYGVEYASQSNIIKEKVKKTNLERYGVENIFEREDILDYYKDIAWNRILANKNWTPKFTKDEFWINCWSNNSIQQQYPFECNKCHKTSMLNRVMTLCPHCYKYTGISLSEDELLNYIKSIYNNGDIIEHDRSILNGKELDIYIPSKNIAFEFDGLYWHSENILHDKNYHLNKSLNCLNNDVRLIHIFEDEWIYKNDIVKSRIKSILNIYDNVLYARKCTIKEVSYKDSCNFLNMNHIQGEVVSKINIGLYYEDELVSILTFGSYRKSMGKSNVDNEYELLRFCNKINYKIHGSASKLLNYFECKYKPQKIISYADYRWSVGDLYNKLGFKFVKNTDVNYWYFKNNIRENRFKYRKSELPKLLQNFNNDESEQQNMINNGYYIIYDCGNLLFEKLF